MREIVPGRLWIGNAGDGRHSERLLAAGVGAVINLAAEEPSPVLPRSMVYCHFPIMDGAQDGQGILDVAIRTLVSLLKNQVPTLVYCGAGMSRSPAVVAVALSIVQGGKAKERLREVVAGYPHDVSPQLWEAVQDASRRINWPFADPRNTAVITLKSITMGGSPILRVTHDAEDGMWQFLDGSTVSEDNSSVVSLEDITRIDPSVMELADLPLGGAAWRSTTNEPWQRRNDAE